MIDTRRSKWSRPNDRNYRDQTIEMIEIRWSRWLRADDRNDWDQTIEMIETRRSWGLKPGDRNGLDQTIELIETKQACLSRPDDWDHTIEILLIFFPYHRRSHRTGCTGPDPTNFWESNMGPAQYCVASIDSLQLGPYYLFNPGCAPVPYA